MLDRLRREDDGFTLVETLAAMIVFAILAVSVGSVILNTFDLTKSNTSRVVAANLAAEQIEATRALRAIDIVDGPAPNVERLVNGVKYRIARNVNLVEADSGTSLCSGPSTSSGVQLSYKLVTVTVEWDGMGSVQPVRQDTLLSLGIGFSGMDPALGTAAVGVRGANGQVQSGVTVTLTPGPVQRTTGGDGCAVFTGLVPGTTYAASVSQADWVSPSGTKTLTSASFTVTASGVTRIPLEYEPVGGLSMTLAGPAGMQPPATLGMTLSNSRFASTDRPFGECAVSADTYGCVSGQPRTAAALYPGQYGVRAGTCSDGLSATPQLATVSAGSTTAVTVPLAGVRVEVRTSGGVLATGWTVYALHAADGVCTSQSWPMTPAGASTQSLALPAGTWTFALTSNGAPLSAATVWPTQTLAVGSPVPTVVVTAQ